MTAPSIGCFGRETCAAPRQPHICYAGSDVQDTRGPWDER